MEITRRFRPFHCGLLVVPLALAILAAELVNILTFHAAMNPEGFAPGLLATVLWILVFLQYRASFNGIFSAKPATQP